MLDELRISGLGVIDEAVLPLGPGLTVLTGETGAGKTMVVSALLLLFGGRGDATRVRAGATQSTVDGRLMVAADSAVIARVEDAGGSVDEDGSLLLRRVVAAAGRSRAIVGGAPVPVSVLGDLAERLIAVHGQADQQRLVRPAQHRAALDRYAGIDTAEYRTTFAAWRHAADQLAERNAHARELRLEAETLSRGVEEIAAADPQPGEDVDLATEASRLAHVDALRIAALQAHDAVLGDPDDPAGDTPDVAGLLGAARRALVQIAGADSELDALSTRLDGLAAAVTDLGADLASYRDGLDADPGRLEQVEARRAVLGGLVRRYGEDVEEVLKWASAAGQRLAELDVSDDALARLAAERDALGDKVAELAAQLSRQRTAAATRLAAAITAELSALAMPAARVLIDVRPRPASSGVATLTIAGQPVGAGATGIDDVELQLQAHPDSPPVALGKGASGGELSRVMLAVEVCLAETNPVPTMVFDEVDAGVGGRAATELGRRLAQLARAHQVIVVTHLAQVAAFGDRHIVVDKPAAVSGLVLHSDVREVEGEERVAELARMLSGTDSATARQHATELLDSAAVLRATAAPSSVQPGAKSLKGAATTTGRRVVRR